jgi:hypothetical protein
MKGGLRVRWAVVLAAGIVLAAGCADGGNDAAESDQAGEQGSQAEGVGPVELGPEEDTSLAVDPVALARDRQMVRTGDMQLVVEDVETAAEDVRQIAEDADGFVADEELRASSAEGDLTVRVPAADFQTVRGQVAELGDVSEQQVETEDVTAEVVDVETRIAVMRASVERLQELLGRAGDVAQLAGVEGELARREVELESLLGQQRLLVDQVALATLTVHLSEHEQPSPSDDAAGFADGLRQGWVVAVNGGRATLAAVGFLLPFAIPAVPAAVAVRWWIRRRGAVATAPEG